MSSATCKKATRKKATRKKATCKKATCKKGKVQVRVVGGGGVYVQTPF